MSQVKLSIRGVELSVLLGWIAEERQKTQTVLLDIDITFEEAPKACQTDELVDTVCYATLIAKIRDHIANRTFKLIEYLSQDIYNFIQQEISGIKHLDMHLVKFPSVPGLSGGVRFSHLAT